MDGDGRGVLCFCFCFVVSSACLEIFFVCEEVAICKKKSWCQSHQRFSIDYISAILYSNKFRVKVNNIFFTHLSTLGSSWPWPLDPSACWARIRSEEPLPERLCEGVKAMCGLLYFNRLKCFCYVRNQSFKWSFGLGVSGFDERCRTQFVATKRGCGERRKLEIDVGGCWQIINVIEKWQLRQLGGRLIKNSLFDQPAATIIVSTGLGRL